MTLVLTMSALSISRSTLAAAALPDSALPSVQQPEMAADVPSAPTASNAATEVAQPSCAVTGADSAANKYFDASVSLLGQPNPIFSSSSVNASRNAAAAVVSGAVPEYFVHVPATLRASRPARVFLAIHGVGGNGADFAAPLISLADAKGWILAAPTLAYHNIASPLDTRADELTIVKQLDALLQDVPRRTGHNIQDQIVEFGFSRGAGVAERFALFEPARVAAAAVMSSGAYTLPQLCAETDGRRDPLPLPFGTSDLKRWLGADLDAAALRSIPFWIGVGAQDLDPGSPTGQWDSILGRTRVDRAASFSRNLV